MCPGCRRRMVSAAGGPAVVAAAAAAAAASDISEGRTMALLWSGWYVGSPIWHDVTAVPCGVGDLLVRCLSTVPLGLAAFEVKEVSGQRVGVIHGESTGAATHNDARDGGGFQMAFTK